MKQVMLQKAEITIYKYFQLNVIRVNILNIKKLAIFFADILYHLCIIELLYAYIRICASSFDFFLIFLYYFYKKLNSEFNQLREPAYILWYWFDFFV